ncbi:MAG: hypothetical protein U0360_04240 [Dehalococcoidia bacterium]
MSAVRAPLRRTLVRIASCVAVLGMLAPALAAVSPDLQGWRPDHAHLVLGGSHAAVLRTGVPPAHTHPYDRPAEPAAPSHREGADQVAFLSPDDGATSAVAAAPAGPLVSAPAAFLVAWVPAQQPPVGRRGIPEPPPPRS